MIFNRKQRKKLEAGSFCRISTKAYLNLPEIESASYWAKMNRTIIRNKKTIKQYGVSVADVSLFYIKGKSPFGNDLLTLRPAIIEKDNYGMAVNMLLDKNILFTVADSALDLCIENPLQEIKDQLIYDSTAKKLIKRIQE